MFRAHLLAGSRCLAVTRRRMPCRRRTGVGSGYGGEIPASRRRASLRGAVAASSHVGVAPRPSNTSSSDPQNWRSADTVPVRWSMARPATGLLAVIARAWPHRAWLVALQVSASITEMVVVLPLATRRFFCPGE